MPQQFWRHVCRGRDVLRATSDCRLCRRRGVFDGWRLKWWEILSLYHYVYRLNPMGPHRELADRLFAGMRDRCVRCDGRAVLTVGDGSAWRACPDCEGTGGVWNRPFEEVDAAWRQVVAHWPNPITQQPALQIRQHEPARTQDERDGAGRASSTGEGSWTADEPGWQPPEPAHEPRSNPSGRSARRRPSGYSSHGLSFAGVQRAFAEAERFLGTAWQLKGRGHCRRVSLAARYSTYAMTGAARSWAWVTPHRSMTPRRLMPLAIVTKAAEILDVPARLLICREW